MLNVEWGVRCGNSNKTDIPSPTVLTLLCRSPQEQNGFD